MSRESRVRQHTVTQQTATPAAAATLGIALQKVMLEHGPPLVKQVAQHAAREILRRWTRR